MRCRSEGHKAKGCIEPPKCLILSGKSENSKHPVEGLKCPVYKIASADKSKCMKYDLTWTTVTRPSNCSARHLLSADEN